MNVLNQLVDSEAAGKAIWSRYKPAVVSSIWATDFESSLFASLSAFKVPDIPEQKGKYHSSTEWPDILILVMLQSTILFPIQKNPKH